MRPFSSRMYRDDVVFYKADRDISGMGHDRPTYDNDPGTPMRASVQSEKPDQAEVSGRAYTTLNYAVYTPTDPQAGPDDKFEWRGRTLIVEGATDTKGIGGVTWKTQCMEGR